MPLVAHVVHGRDGHAVWVTEMPLRWQVAQWFFGEVFPSLTFHLMCCHTPDWMYAAGFGRDDGPEEIRLPHRWSLGQFLFGLGQRAGSVGFRHEKRLAEIPVSDEYVLGHFPDLFMGLGDEVRSKPKDAGEVRL